MSNAVDLGTLSVAETGFPVGGGVDLVGGTVDPRGGYVWKILYVKTKESGPVGGARAGRAPPRSANDCHKYDIPIKIGIKPITGIDPFCWLQHHQQQSAHFTSKLLPYCFICTSAMGIHLR